MHRLEGHTGANLEKPKLYESIVKTKEILKLPEDYKVGIVPGSDTGAFEMLYVECPRRKRWLMYLSLNPLVKAGQMTS